ncbi:DNRLRE domain-containing protein, partial [Candidatus Bipolaricaulota bacterium]|nr:DNRLRE domain-containing protein [Candidatus Bipolaricaulota bacterium]
MVRRVGLGRGLIELIALIFVTSLIIIGAIPHVGYSSQCTQTVEIPVTHTAWVDNDHPNQSNYDQSLLHVRARPKHHCGGHNVRRTYYYFDLSALPSGAIVSAKFKIDPTCGGDPGDLALHSTSWSGSPITWSSQPGPGALLNTRHYNGGTGTITFNVSSALSGSPSEVGFVVKFSDESPSEKEHCDHVNPRLVITVACQADLEVTKECHALVAGETHADVYT